MKNFIYVLVICFLATSQVFSQSILLTPTQMNSNQTTNDQIILKGTTAPNIAGVRFSGTLASPTATLAGSAPLTLDGRGYDGANFTIGRGKIIFFATENWSQTANGTNIQFWTTTNGTISTTEKMRIGNDGNVGIGTTAPLASLEVARGTGVNGTAAFQGTTNTSHFNYSSAENTYIRGGMATSNVIISDVSGNVAVGNGVPLDKLHVFGNIKASGDANIGGEVNRPQTSAANVVPIAYGNVSSSGVLQTSSSTDNVSVSKSGTGLYIITIAGETFNNSNYTTIATINDSYFGFISTTGVSSLNIVTGGVGGAFADLAFTFAVYKK